MVPNQTGVHFPEGNKADLLMPGCGKGKCGIYYKTPSKESRQLVLQRPKLPDGFQGTIFKDRVKEEGCGALSGS